MRAHWRRIAFFGVTGTGLHNVLGYLGIRETTATNAVLIQSVTPGLIPLFALLVFRERIGARAVLGLAVSFCGVLAIVSRVSLVCLLDLRFNPGGLFLLGNVLRWALYTVCLRWKPPTLSHLSFLLACALFGIAPMLPLYAADVLAGGRVEPTWGTRCLASRTGAYFRQWCATSSGPLEFTRSARGVQGCTYP